MSSSGRQIQLNGLFISAKRHSLTRPDGSFADFKESILGMFSAPAEGWIEEAWRTLGEMWDGRRLTPRPWFELPAVRCITLSSPAYARELKGLPNLRPWNRLLAAIAIGRKPGASKPRTAIIVAPFEPNPNRWPALSWRFAESGEPAVFERPDAEGVQWRIRTLRDLLSSYVRHAIPEMLAPDGSRCGPYTRGVLKRRPIRDGKRWVLLKEAVVYGDGPRNAFSVPSSEAVAQPNAADQDGASEVWDKLIKPALAVVGPAAVARKMGVKPRTARAWMAGERQPENVAQVARAIVDAAEEAGLGLAMDEHVGAEEICAELPARAAAAQCLIAVVITMFAEKLGGRRALGRAMAGEGQTDLEPSLRRWGGLARSPLRPIDDLNVVVVRLADFSRTEIRTLGRRLVSEPGPPGDRQVLVAYLSLLCGADRPLMMSPSETLALPLAIAIAGFLAALMLYFEASASIGQSGATVVSKKQNLTKHHRFAQMQRHGRRETPRSSKT
jgi:hypothetical protein